MSVSRFFLFILSLMVGSLSYAQTIVLGDSAPDFTLQASDGNTYTLPDYIDKQAVVIS